MSQQGLVLYHQTTLETAHDIHESGFKDSVGYFLNNRIWTGVWLSSLPPEPTSPGCALLKVKVDLDYDQLCRWEWAGEGSSYREWLIPANILNRCATVEESINPPK
jgi:hypothetical protein